MWRAKFAKVVFFLLNKKTGGNCFALVNYSNAPENELKYIIVTGTVSSWGKNGGKRGSWAATA